MIDGTTSDKRVVGRSLISRVPPKPTARAGPDLGR